jgi:hypothetical protein
VARPGSSDILLAQAQSAAIAIFLDFVNLFLDSLFGCVKGFIRCSGCVTGYFSGCSGCVTGYFSGCVSCITGYFSGCVRCVTGYFGGCVSCFSGHFSRWCGGFSSGISSCAHRLAGFLSCGFRVFGRSVFPQLARATVIKSNIKTLIILLIVINSVLCPRGKGHKG